MPTSLVKKRLNKRLERLINSGICPAEDVEEYADDLKQLVNSVLDVGSIYIYIYIYAESSPKGFSQSDAPEDSQSTSNKGDVCLRNHGCPWLNPANCFASLEHP